MATVDNKSATVTIAPGLDILERQAVRGLLADLGIFVNDKFQPIKVTGFTVTVDQTLKKSA